jgi:uncharacterized protein
MMNRYVAVVFLAGLVLASGAAAATRGTPLIAAVRDGDVKAVRMVLAQKSDVNTPGADGMTALHWAVQNNDLSIVEALLAAGANVNAITAYDVQAINLAAMNGNAALLERLLKKGADANFPMPDGATPLMLAARNGAPDAVKVLLAAGAKIDAREKGRSQNALMWAAREGNVEAVKILVEAGADINAHSRMPATRAVAARTDGAGRPILPAPAAPAATPAAAPAPKPYVADADDDIDPDAVRGNSLVLKKVYPKGRDISAQAYGTRTVTEGLTPLLFATREGDMDTVRTLLDLGAKLDEPASDGTTALFMAIVNAHWELASLLLDRGANPNAFERGISPLQQLVVTRRLHLGHLPHPHPSGKMTSMALAQKLLDKGARINERMTANGMGDGYRNRINRAGATPFWLAAKGIDPEMMKFLVSKGADPKIPNVENTTALMVAAGVGQFNPGEDAGSEEESLEAVKYSVSVGLDVNAIDDNGETALHGTAYKGFNKVAQYLADQGAKLDVRNVLGWTPLTVANGVMYSNFYKSQRHTGALLAKLMKERGIEANTDLDISGAGYVKDLKPTAEIGVPTAQPKR